MTPAIDSCRCDRGSLVYFKYIQCMYVYIHTETMFVYTHICEQCLNVFSQILHIYIHMCMCEHMLWNIASLTNLSKPALLALSTRLWLYPSGHRVQLHLLGNVPHMGRWQRGAVQLWSWSQHGLCGSSAAALYNFAVLVRALSQERRPGIDAKLSKRGLVQSAKT